MLVFESVYSFDRNSQRLIDESLEHRAHAERRPRALKYSTDKFYNFPRKRKKKFRY